MQFTTYFTCFYAWKCCGERVWGDLGCARDNLVENGFYNAITILYSSEDLSFARILARNSACDNSLSSFLMPNWTLVLRKVK